MKISLRKLAEEKLFNDKTNIDVNTSKYYDDEIKSSNKDLKEWLEPFKGVKSGIIIIQKNWSDILPDRIQVGDFEYDISNEKNILIKSSKPKEIKKGFNKIRAQENELIIVGLNNNDYKTVLNSISKEKLEAINKAIIDKISYLLQINMFENVCLVQKIKWE